VKELPYLALTKELVEHLRQAITNLHLSTVVIKKQFAYTDSGACAKRVSYTYDPLNPAFTLET
jgi:hypothetical protein